MAGTNPAVVAVFARALTTFSQRQQDQVERSVGRIRLPVIRVVTDGAKRTKQSGECLRRAQNVITVYGAAFIAGTTFGATELQHGHIGEKVVTCLTAATRRYS